LSTAADISENPQLAFREYWAEIEHKELGDSVVYPGPFGKSSQASPRISRRAPLIGEHNIEIYERELGISRDKLVTLKQAGVI
jgi:crotonobetainyl-CoA:carnitine CoA-transferase CaiB-like acyl-CoA transferase